MNDVKAYLIGAAVGVVLYIVAKNFGFEMVITIQPTARQLLKPTLEILSTQRDEWSWHARCGALPKIVNNFTLDKHPLVWYIIVVREGISKALLLTDATSTNGEETLERKRRLQVALQFKTEEHERQRTNQTAHQMHCLRHQDQST